MKWMALVDGRLANPDEAVGAEIVEVGPGVYSVLDGERSLEVRVIANGAGYAVYAGGRRFEVELFDPRDRKSASAANARQGPQSVTAPMPGKVIRTLVEAGAEVAAGEGLVVVEAMKMQNEIKSPKTGRVVELRARAGVTVNAGDVLVVVD